MAKKRPPKRDSIDEVGPYFVVVPLRMTHAPGFTHTYLHMTFSDTGVQMVKGTAAQRKAGKGKFMGEVIGCLGGGTEIKIGNDFTFTLGHPALWRAVYDQIADNGKVKDLVGGQKSSWEQLVELAKGARKRERADDDHVSDDIVYLAQQMADIILGTDAKLRKEMKR